MITRSALAPVPVALMLCLAVLTFGGLTSRATARGGDGLNEQISTAELTEYAKMLHLSPEQLLAAESMHDDYKRAYAALRDGPAAEVMEKARSFGSRVPNREDFTEFLREFDLFADRLRALDEALFDRIQGILSDEQAAIMPRTRLRRERARYVSHPMLDITDREMADLGELVAQIDLSDEEMAAIEPILIAWISPS